MRNSSGSRIIWRIRMEEFRPAMLNAPPNPLGQEWWCAVWEAWNCSKAGRVSQARALYEYADSLLDEYELNASLSVLRHSGGVGSGAVRPVPPTEDTVVSMLLPRLRSPAADAPRLVERIPDRRPHVLSESDPPALDEWQLEVAAPL